MNAKRDRVFKELFKALYQANNKGTSGYDTTAEVVRVEGDTVWVHIPGGVDETPVKKTIDAVKGDTVQLRVSGGTAWIVGNETKPPTDDRVANVAKKTAENADLKAILAKKTADNASKVATNYIDFTEEDGLTVGYKDLNSKVNISGDGVKLYDEDGNVGTEIKSGEVIVGTDETNQITLNEDGIVLSSVEDVETFKAGVSETTVEITYTENFNENGGVLSRLPNSGSRIQVGYYTLGLFTIRYYFTQGVAETKDDITYDGERTFTSSSTSLSEYNYVKYIVTAHPPNLTFGTRDIARDIGAFSATFGRDLIASKEQTVFGKFNVEDTNGDYSVIVGNGSSSERSSNALSLDNNGTLHLKGDVYVGCSSTGYGGNKLVSASAQGGSGTKSNVATGTTLKNLTSVTLSDAGVYLLLGLARFPANANGRRGLAWGSTTTEYFDNSLVVVPPVTESNGITRIQSMAIVTVASSFNVYLNCYHTAGTQLNVDYYWRYIKLA